MQTKKIYLLPGLALAGGAVGFLLRGWQIDAAYNPIGEFFVSGQPSTYALVSLLAVVLVLLALLVRGGRTPEDFLPLMGFRSAPLMALSGGSAALFVMAGIMELSRGRALLTQWREAADVAEAMGSSAPPPVTTPLSVLLCGALCIPAAVAVLSMASDAHKHQLTKKTCLLACAPAAAGLVWVFSIHLSNGVNPILMDYGFLLAAACLLTLCQYYAAASLFDHVCPRRMLFCGLSGIVLGLTAAADRLRLCHDVPAVLLLLALSLAALAWVLAAVPNVYGQNVPTPAEN